MFTMYLMGFVVYGPWREECRRESDRLVTNISINGEYHRVNVEDNADILNADDEAESQEEQPVAETETSRDRLFRQSDQL